MKKHSFKISVYAIAKNEAKFAKRWYDCVKEADEVCVLDTGSTDDTVGILTSLGARVESRTFNPFDFAAARNASLGMCSADSDYLFCMDLDETIAPGWREILESHLIEAASRGIDATAVEYREVLNYKPDGSYNEVFRQLKIHRPGTAHWNRPIHECLEFEPFRPIDIPTLIVEHHPDDSKNREFYIDMLKDSVSKPDADIRSYFYLGQEYLRRARYKDAIENFYTYVSRQNGVYLAVERCLAMVGISKAFRCLGDNASAELWLWRASAEDQKNREPLYWLGTLAYNRKDYKAAVSIMSKCISIPDKESMYHREAIAYSESPMKVLSDALWLIDRKQESFDVAKNMLSQFPNSNVAQDQFNGIGMALGKIK